MTFEEFDVAVDVAIEERGSLANRRLLRRRPHLRRAVTVLAQEHWVQEVVGGEMELAASETPFLDFLRWLIENPEKLAEFIRIIMSLFA